MKNTTILKEKFASVLKKIKKIAICHLTITMLFTSCMVDLRKGTDLENKSSGTPENVARAKKIVNNFYKKNGYEKFAKVNTYEVDASEIWRGMMGNMGNPWPMSDLEFKMHFIPNKFVGKVEIRNGDEKGQTWGRVYNLEYKLTPDKKVKFEENKNLAFMIANYQYWLEFPYRINQLKNVAYAGEKKKNGITYDLVFATWGNNLEVSDEYDQFLLWFNKNNGDLELATYTYRKFPGMSPPFMYGTSIFKDYENFEGLKIPKTYIFQINGPEDENEFAHKMTIQNIKFDTLEKSSLMLSGKKN